MIPIYRAKCKRQSRQHETDAVTKVDGVWYITGFYSNGYISADIQDRAILASYSDLQEVDKDTLSINFPDMIDSQGAKVFASLSESGLGGDVVRGYNNIWSVKMFKGKFISIWQEGYGYKSLDSCFYEDLTVISIQN